MVIKQITRYRPFVEKMLTAVSTYDNLRHVDRIVTEEGKTYKYDTYAIFVGLFICFSTHHNGEE